MLRPWDLNFTITREINVAIHEQIAQKIIEEIQGGRFSPGDALPGTRELASKIKVNRKTVVQAYDELIAQGWLTSENKRGTFVSSRVIIVNSNPVSLNHKSDKFSSSRVNTTVKLTQSKRHLHDCIHFCDGLPDARLTPFEMLSRATRHAIIVVTRQYKKSYMESKGAQILREALSAMLNMERGLHSDTDNICVARSSQMAIFIVAKVLVATGDCIVLERLGNLLVREAFINCGATILNVDHDYDGICVESLEQLCVAKQKMNLKIKAVYVTPNHQIPTTVTMSGSRRAMLLALADQYDFLIIENDQDYEFNFISKPILPIASMKNSKRVIYIGAVAKVLTSGFQLGYIVADESVINACAYQSSLIDPNDNQIAELAVAELLFMGEIKKHRLRIHIIYEERRNHLANLLMSELGEFSSFSLADCGLAFWVQLNSSINIDNFVKSADAHQVKFQLGGNFASHDQNIPFIRLGFSSLNDTEMAQGIKRLKNVFLDQNVSLETPQMAVRQ